MIEIFTSALKEREKQIGPPGICSFLLFLCVTLITLILFYTSFTLIPLYVLELGGNSFHSGLQNAVFFLGAVIMRFYLGPLADTRGRKIPLLIGVFVFATSTLLFGMCQNIFQLILVRFYQSIGLASFFSAGNSLAADFATPGRIGLYIGGNRMMYSLALLAGPWLGQAVINDWGYSVWFGFASFLGGLAFCLMLIVRTPKVTLKAPQKFLTVTWEALQTREFWPILGHVGVIAAVYGILLTFIPIYLNQEVRLASSSLYFICFGLAGVMINLLSGYLSDRWGRKAIVIPAMGSMIIALVLLFLASAVPLLVYISAFCAGASFAGGLAVLAAWLVDKAGLKLRTTVLALYDNSIDLAVACGSFLIGILNQWISLPLIFLLIASLTLVYLVVVVTGSRLRIFQGDQ